MAHHTTVVTVRKMLTDCAVLCHLRIPLYGGRVEGGVAAADGIKECLQAVNTVQNIKKLEVWGKTTFFTALWLCVVQHVHPCLFCTLERDLFSAVSVT